MQKADHETAKKPEPSIAVHAGQTSDREPCSDCPWRIANHGRRHPGGFFRKDNLRRLWNQIRKGGGMQTCRVRRPLEHARGWARQWHVLKDELGGRHVRVRSAAKVMRHVHVRLARD